MRRHLPTTWLAIGFTLLLAVGCAPTQPFYFFESGDLKHYIGMATQIEQPDVKQAPLSETCDPPPPLSLSNSHYVSIWELPLQEAILISLENSKVMRTLGARFATTGGSRPQVGDAPTVLLGNSNAVPTVYDPALVESNPNTGVEGAASAYDALFASSIEWDHEHVPQNINPAFAFQNGVLTDDVDTFTAGITKRTESGGIVSITNTDTYTDSNNPSLGLSHDNQAVVDLGFQQRLLRGGGTFFNQIHGPLDFNQTGIGQNFDGVVIARINMDMGLADFEAGVRNLVNDVENAYWELYFAYRALDAAKVGRDSALETWKKIYALYIVAARGGEADKEAQSREQYFTFRAQVEQALTDLYRIENRLRYLMGLAATDGRLIRPKDEPTTAHVVFEWCDVHAEGLARSVELRKEKWHIKQLELELMASKNLLLPNLDFNGHYRFFGLGDDLTNANGTAFTGTNSIVGTDATSTLTTGQFATWTFGLNFSQEIGNRRNLSTIRNQQLQLTRERCVLQDQELELSHQITDAVRNLDTQYRLMQTNFNVRVASQQEVAAIEVASTRPAPSRSTCSCRLSSGVRRPKRLTTGRSSTTIGPSPKSTTSKARCWNTTTCIWRKARGPARPTSTLAAMPASATPASTSTTATRVPTRSAKDRFISSPMAARRDRASRRKGTNSRPNRSSPRSRSRNRRAIRSARTARGPAAAVRATCSRMLARSMTIRPTAIRMARKRPHRCASRAYCMAIARRSARPLQAETMAAIRMAVRRTTSAA